MKQERCEEVHPKVPTMSPRRQTTMPAGNICYRQGASAQANPPEIVMHIIRTFVRGFLFINSESDLVRHLLELLALCTRNWTCEVLHYASECRQNGDSFFIFMWLVLQYKELKFVMVQYTWLFYRMWKSNSIANDVFSSEVGFITLSSKLQTQNFISPNLFSVTSVEW